MNTEVSLAESPIEPAELVARILAGDHDAEIELFYRYKSGVAIVTGRIVHCPDATRDISQETFRLVLEKVRRGDLRDAKKLSGFVCGIARNLAFDHLRSAKRLVMIGDTDSIMSIPDSAPDQLDQLLQSEEKRLIHQILQELECARDRELLFRFYLTEEDKEQICRDLGLSSLHFNRVLFRARERFRKLYENAAVIDG